MIILKPEAQVFVINIRYKFLQTNPEFSTVMARFIRETQNMDELVNLVTDSILKIVASLR